MKQITANELRQKIEAKEKVNIVDVRTAPEVAKGKIVGAKHIPVNEITERLHELSKNEQYYMVCTSGGRSDLAAKQLNRAGYEAVNVIDGMEGWQGEVE